MTVNTNRRMILKEYPKAAPGPEHFEIVEAPAGEPGPGEVLVRAIYLTVDPYMRGRLRPGPSYAEPQKIGEVMVGEVAGEIVASKADGFAVGDFVAAHTGWQTHGVADARDIRKLDPKAAPISTALGVLGMPGLTAYFGTLEVLTPRAGDTLVVNGDGKQSRDFTYVDTVTEVIARAVTQRIVNDVPVNLAFGGGETLLDLISRLEAAFDRELPVEHGPSRAGDIRHSTADPSRLFELFPDIEPIDFSEGLRRTVEWWSR